MSLRHAALLLAALSLLPQAASADRHYDSPTSASTWQVADNDDWNSLSEQEQTLLKKYRHDWNSYSPKQKAQLREGVKRYQKLSPAERQDVERERERYETMSPQERRALRDKYDRSRDR